jgi:hypothetical protein
MLRFGRLNGQAIFATFPVDRTNMLERIRQSRLVAFPGEFACVWFVAKRKESAR